MVGGQFQFINMNPVTIAAGLTNVLPKGVIGYDPSDATAYAQVVSGCQDEQHLLYSLTIAAANGVSTTTTNFSKSECFRWKVPPGVLQNSTLNVSSWQATNTTGGALLPYGYLKLYSSGHVVSTATVGGIITWFMEFRIRE